MTLSLTYTTHSLTTLFKILIFTVLTLSVSSQVTVQPQLYEINGTIPNSDPTVNYNFTITPGTTQRIDVTLTGDSQIVVFTFLSDPSRTDAFKLTVSDNGKVTSPTMTYFQSPETLTASLDTKKLLFVLQGNLRFRISKYVKEKQYALDILVEEKVLVPITAVEEDVSSYDLPIQNNDRSFDKTIIYYIVAAIIAGILSLVLGAKLYIKMKNSWHKSWFARWNKLRKLRLPRENTNINGLITAGPAVIFNRTTSEQDSPQLKLHRTPFKKSTIHEIDSEDGLQISSKKTTITLTPSSLSSLEYGNTRNTNGALTTSMSKVVHSTGSYGSLQNVGSGTSSINSASSGSSNSLSDGPSSIGSRAEGAKGLLQFLGLPVGGSGSKRTSVVSAGGDIKHRFKLAGNNLEAIKEESPMARNNKLSLNMHRLPPIELNEKKKRNTWFAKRPQITPLTIEEKSNWDFTNKNELDSPAPMLFTASPSTSPHKRPRMSVQVSPTKLVPTASPLPSPSKISRMSVIAPQSPTLLTAPSSASPNRAPRKSVQMSPSGAMLLLHSMQQEAQEKEFDEQLRLKIKMKKRHKPILENQEEILKMVQEMVQQKEDRREITESDTDSDQEPSIANKKRQIEYHLPNYFCCMICLRETRNTVAKPCGHVFTCSGCSKKVMASSKACFMCTSRVKGFKTLKMSTVSRKNIEAEDE